MISVLLADSDPTVRLGVRSLLEKYRVASVIEETFEIDDLLASVLYDSHDLLIIEPVISNEANFAVLRRIRAMRPELGILVLTDLDDKACGERALQCGAKGVLSKSCSGEELVAAVRRVANGGIYISDALATELALMQMNVREIAPHRLLSARETQVFSLLVCGKSTTEIGRILGLSSKTVSTHKARLFIKLRIKSLSEMVQYAISHGLLETNRADCARLVAKKSVSWETNGCAECT